MGVCRPLLSRRPPRRARSVSAVCVRRSRPSFIARHAFLWLCVCMAVHGAAAPAHQYAPRFLRAARPVARPEAGERARAARGHRCAACAALKVSCSFFFFSVLDLTFENNPPTSGREKNFGQAHPPSVSRRSKWANATGHSYQVMPPPARHRRTHHAVGLPSGSGLRAADS